MADEEKVKQVPLAVDLNNMDLVDEPLDVNAEADAFAGPPPIPDGPHIFKLKVSAQKDAPQGVKRFTSKKDGRVFDSMHLQLNAVAPGTMYDNSVAFDDASTYVMQSGTCRVVGILKLLGVSVSARTSSLELMRALRDALVSEPPIGAVTQWEAYCADDGCRKVVARSERKFKQLPDGSHSASLECPTCGTMLNAQAKVVKYLSVDQVTGASPATATGAAGAKAVSVTEEIPF